MEYEALQTLARSNRWTELEKGWLSAIERPDVDASRLLPVIDLVVKAGKEPLADTMGWAWLSTMKEARSAPEALQLGRDLLVRLTDGDELREEILDLYRRTHTDRADLEAWIDRSGLKSGKSVRRALRFLDVGLSLKEGACLLHRTEDTAAEVTALDLESGTATVRTARRTQTLDLAALIEEYDVVPENDFRVLIQLRPQKIAELAESDPASLVIGVVRAHGNKMVREGLKLLLCPKYIPSEKWSDWWGRLRNAVKKSPNLRIEGRSPMFLIYDAVGQTPEQEAWVAFSKAQEPREWLELLEAYLRLCREQKKEPDTPFLNRVQAALVGHIGRFSRHKEPASAFATALVIERVAADGLPVSTDAHGMALEMIGRAEDPVAVAAAIPDTRLWALAVNCLEQAYPQRWPELFAELILYAPAGQCDILARKVEKAGRGDLLPAVVQRAIAEPGRFTDALMWIWKGPEVETPLNAPPALELLSLVLGLVGPARASEGRAVGQSVTEMRARVRAGLSSKEYARFRQCVYDAEESMGLALRRQVERAEGLGPSVQEDMGNIVRARFPQLYVKPKVAPWEDDSVLYFTPKGLAAKEQELNELVNVKMRENAKAIGEAASHGDLSENSEYKFALEERDLLRARVAKLNRELSMARVVEKADIPTDHVGIGQRVTLRPAQGGDQVVLTLLGADESDIAHQVYSYQSPLARQLLGRKPGEVVTLNLAGHEGEFLIEAVASALE